MARKYLIAVFGGSGFLTEAANRLGLRGYVLDTKFADNTLRALPKSFPPVLPLLACFIVLACRGIWNIRVIRGCGTCTGSHGLALADVCILGSQYRKHILFPVGNVDSRDLHRIARQCAGTGGRYSV